MIRKLSVITTVAAIILAAIGQTDERPSGARFMADDAGGLVESEVVSATAPRTVALLTTLQETSFALDLGNSQDVTSDSLEQSQPGPFDKLETEIGRWTPEVGRTIVDNQHAKTGKQCLQLTGGNKTSVTLGIADDPIWRLPKGSSSSRLLASRRRSVANLCAD